MKITIIVNQRNSIRMSAAGYRAFNSSYAIAVPQTDGTCPGKVVTLQGKRGKTPIFTFIETIGLSLRLMIIIKLTLYTSKKRPFFSLSPPTTPAIKSGN